MTDEFEAMLDNVTAQSDAYIESASAVERRRYTNRMNTKVAESESDGWLSLEQFTYEMMVERWVYVDSRHEIVILPPADMPYCGKRLSPKKVEPLFKSYHQHVMEHPTRVDRNDMPVLVKMADMWFGSPEMKTVEDVVFAIGEGRFIENAIQQKAVNLWTPRKFYESDADIGLYLEHIEYLIPNEEDREVFHNFLAHAEQFPTELPHYGILMFTETFGIGRNWVSSVLYRLWRSEVAGSLDLSALLGNQFNTRLSCKRLAIVDEIHIGGDKWHNQAAKLRQMMTAEIKEINGKYALPIEERNCCRWLFFSNHDDAMPIEAGDRRFYVIANPTEPRSEETYKTLYKSLNNQDMIAAIWHFYATRDISNFNIGEKPKMTEAKLRVVNASENEYTKSAKEIVSEWKSQGYRTFTAADLKSAIEFSGSEGFFGHIIKSIGADRIGKYKIVGKLETIYCLDREPIDLEVEKRAIIEHRKAAEDDSRF